MRFSTIVVAIGLAGLAGLASASVRAQVQPRPRSDAPEHAVKHTGPAGRMLRLELPLLAASESYDFYSTSQVDPRVNHENNPLLGRHPSDTRLATYGLAEFGAYAWTLDHTEHSRRAWLRWAGRAAVAAQVGIHVAYGIRNEELRRDRLHEPPFRHP